MMLMMAVLLVFSMAGQASADFDNTYLLRAVYDTAGTLESVTGLGPITDKTEPFTYNVIYNSDKFTTAMFGGADFSKLRVAYFAVDFYDKDVYLSGPIDGYQLSGNRKLSVINTAITGVIAGYNKILSDDQKMGIMAKSGVQSYYTLMDKNGTATGSFGQFLTLPFNGEASLAPLATVGYVDQTLFYYGNADTSAPGVKMAVIRTFADGHTELNPNAVPVPASVLLLGSGLLGLIGIRRKMAA